MKKILALTLLLASLILTGCGFVTIDPIEPVAPIKSGDEGTYSQTEGINVVPTINDAASGDAAWCATFQLVWNDLKNEYVKQDIQFAIPSEMVDNLNLETFKEKMISDEYYYKTWGKKTLEKKAEIEKGIKDKFDEKSDVLDLIDWENLDSEDCERMIFYTMLRRNFEYPKEFSKLKNGTFADKYENVKYFGIDASTDEQVFSQVRVLFYNSPTNFAVVLETKGGDEVILCKNPTGNNFGQMYAAVQAQANAYKGDKRFNEMDELKVPYISMDELREYNELCNIPFLTSDGKTVIIDQAMQTIKFDIDEKGGKIKSEAVIATKENSIMMPDEKDPRNFYFDDTFVLFLKEESKDFPYFATLISDITKYQK
jgi:hypothetical protein